MRPGSLLILGNGGAAAHAIQAARSAGYKGEIILVSDSTSPAFNPMLSPYFLAGKISFDQCFPFGERFYEQHEVECRFSSRIVSLDPVNKEVHLANGERLFYDRCLIATGAKPILPDVPGLKDSRYIFTLRTSEDAIRLKQSLSVATNVVIIGASLVGLKLVEIFVHQKIGVSLVDVADHILPRSAHPECATIIENHLINHGVNIYMRQRLKRLEDHGDRAHLFFQEDLSLSADLCVVCIGVKPNLDFLLNSSIEVNQGILIDEKTRTSQNDLYAAGDVSQGMNLLSGERRIIGLWGNACYQGRTAGYNMAGQDVTYPGTIPHYVIHILDLTFAHLGDPTMRGEHVTILSSKGQSKDSHLLLVFHGKELVGANLINCLQIAGKLKTAITQRWNLLEHLHMPPDGLIVDEIDRILSTFHHV